MAKKAGSPTGKDTVQLGQDEKSSDSSQQLDDDIYNEDEDEDEDNEGW